MTSIIEKIRKIQALAENAGTEHEAALAAERVAELCRQHNLDIGVATLVEEEKTASEAQHERAGRWQAHYTYLSAACGEVFHVGHYKKACGIVVKDMGGRVIGSKDGQALVFFGLKANIAAAVETYEYLLASVEALLESHIRTGGRINGASDFRSFRMGCANRIYQEATKIKNAALELQAQAKQVLLHAQAHGQQSDTTGRELMRAQEETAALVRLENKLIEMHRKKMHLRTGSGAAPASNRDAYGAGYAAGARVDFHGARSSRMIGGR